MRHPVIGARFVVALCCASAFLNCTPQPVAGADNPLIEQIRKDNAKLDVQVSELNAKIAKLEAKLATLPEGPERVRLADEIKQATKDVSKIKFDIQYYAALEHEENSKEASKRADELKAKADRINGGEEKTKLLEEAEALRKKAAAADVETTRIMRELAPLDRTGDGRAHLWLAQQLYRFERSPEGKIIPPSPRNILDAERHLLHALESTNDEVVLGAHFGLAKMYRDTNRIEESKKHLLEVARRQPEYRLTLAQWGKMQNETNDTIVSHAKAAEVAFRARLKTSPDDHEARFGLIDCLLLQKKFDEAQADINNGAKLATKADMVRSYARKMTAALIERSDSMVADPKSNLSERLKLLDQALLLDPDNPEVFNRLLKLTKADGPDADRARELFQMLLADGKGSAMAHLFLGIDAWQNKNTKDARHHWQKALELSPDAPLIQNNLAWLLQEMTPEDLAHSLELATAAVKKQPEEMRFRGTRGLILANLGRDREALEELEKAIAAYPNDGHLYKTLAEVCQRLGLTERASQYRRKSNELAPMKPVNDLPLKRPGDA